MSNNDEISKKPEIYLIPFEYRSQSSGYAETSGDDQKKVAITKAIEQLNYGLKVIFHEMGDKIISALGENKPDVFELEFGVGISSGIDFFLVNGKGDFNVKVKAIWHIKTAENSQTK